LLANNYITTGLYISLFYKLEVHISKSCNMSFIAGYTAFDNNISLTTEDGRHDFFFDFKVSTGYYFESGLYCSIDNNAAF